MLVAEAETSLGISDLRAFLAGRWVLTRRIVDRRARRCGRLTGEALFAPEGEGLLYREQGVLRFGAYEGRADRAYSYRFTAPQRAEVVFDDGRFFHRLDLTAGRWSVEHRCQDDLYGGAFRVQDPGAWQVVWEITGPRKDQVLASRYRRAG